MTMTVYNAQLGSDEEQTISAGNRLLTFQFRWDDANEEQYQIVAQALKARRDADPLLKKDSVDIIRDYDYLDYYTSLPKDIDLEELEEYPQSIRKLSEAQQIMELESRRDEAVELQKLLLVYEQQLVWNVRIVDDTGVEKTGAVRPGGWIGNQDIDWRVRFATLLTQVGKNDLSKVYVEMEINDGDS